MNIHTAATEQSFNELKINILNAIALLAEREYEARQAGDDELADLLLERGEELTMRLLRIREAERDFLLSAPVIAGAGSALHQAVGDLRRANDGLRSRATALGAAQQAVSVLIGIATLFR